MIIKKDYDHRKILWSWKNIAIMEKYCDDWNLSNTHEVIKTVLNFSLQKYFTHIKSIKTLNKQLWLRYFLWAQKSIKYIKYNSSIVNEVIRGNFTSIKRIKKTRKIKRIKSIKSTKSIKTLNKQPLLRCFYKHKKQKKSIKIIKTLNKQPLLRCFFICIKSKKKA